MITERRAVGNLNFTVMPLKEAVSLVMSDAGDIAARGRPGIAVHFANAYNVALARRDGSYRNLLNSAEYVFSDGVPITWVGRRAYPDMASTWERVYGPDVMELVLQSSRPAAPLHYLLGSSPDVLRALQVRIAWDFPGATIVGAESPPFRTPTPDDLVERDARIRESGAQMVWVGLGTPKQDYEVARIAATLPIVALAVGAAFDFLAQTTPQAPSWMQKNGLEWAYRFSKEPGRLASRYLWGNSVFLVEAARTLRERD